MRASVNKNRGCEQESCHMTNWVRSGRLNIVCGTLRGWESLVGFDWKLYHAPHDKAASRVSNYLDQGGVFLDEVDCIHP